MRPKLLIRPKPWPDESIYSWLARVSAENASRNKKRVLELSDLLGVNKRIKAVPCFSDEQLIALSGLTGTPAMIIENMLWRQVVSDASKAKFSRQFLFNHRSKVCPICLDQKEYWKKYWQLLPVTCCCEHGVRLTTACKCGKPILIYPNSIIYCDCGRRFSKQKVIDATDAEIKLNNYILSFPSISSETLLASRLYEVQFCLWYWYESIRNSDELLIKSWSYRRITRGVKYVGDLIDGDRINIESLMRRVVLTRGGKEPGFRKSIGDCHDYIQRMQKLGYQGEFNEMLRNFEENIWHNGAILSRARYGKGSILNTKKEFAKQENTSVSKVGRVISYEGSKELTVKSSRQGEYFHRDKHLVLRCKLGKWVSADEASKLLGVSYYCVSQIISADLIVGRKKKADRDWLVSKASCIELLGRLRGGSVSSHGGVEFCPLQSLQLHPDQHLVEVISNCLKGKVEYQLLDDDFSLTGLKFPITVIHQLNSEANHQLITAKGVASMLTINLNAIYYLVKKRYLISLVRYCRNRVVLGFSLSDIDRFRSIYCFYPDAKQFLLEQERRDLLGNIRPLNRSCSCGGKVRVYKWQYLQQLVDSPTINAKPTSTRLFTLKGASQYIGKSAVQLSALIDKEWIVPYQPPGHHKLDRRRLLFTKSDLDRLRLMLDSYSQLMPLRAVAKCLGYDRSHVRKQFIQSKYLPVAVIPEFPKETFCYRKHVFALKRLLKATLSGPELAGHLGVTRNTVYKWMKQGKLKPIITPGQLGFGCYRYSVASIHSLSVKH